MPQRGLLFLLVQFSSSIRATFKPNCEVFPYTTLEACARGLKWVAA